MVAHVGAAACQNALDAVETSAVVHVDPDSFHPASGHEYVGLYEASHFFEVELYVKPLSHVGFWSRPPPPVFLHLLLVESNVKPLAQVGVRPSTHLPVELLRVCPVGHPGVAALEPGTHARIPVHD